MTRSLARIVRSRIYLVALVAAALLIPLVIGLEFTSRRAAGSYTSEISAAASFAWHALILTIALGIVSMAIVECVRRLLPVRGVFHGLELRTQLGNEAFRILLEYLPAGPDRLSWLDAPAEQIFAQLGSFADRAFANVIGAGPARGPQPGDDQRREWGSVFLRSLVSPRDISTPIYRGRERDAEELRSQVDSALDRLQVVIVGRWRRTLRLASCVVAGLLALVVVLFSPAGFGVALLTAAGAFTVGGFFSWFARDVAAGVERWRRR